MTFTCVIDTCSYIYLNKCEIFREKTALQLLHKHTNVIFSRAVDDEIIDHYETPMPTSKERRSNVKTTTLHSVAGYETRLFDNNLPRRAPDKGERDNFSLTIDQYLDGKKIGVIYLTDDENAKKKVINEVWDSFPIYHKWCSLDVILFLYIIKAIPQKELAQDAIRDIDNIIVPDNPLKNRVHTTNEKAKRIATYLGHLNNISKVLN